MSSIYKFYKLNINNELTLAREILNQFTIKEVWYKQLLLFLSKCKEMLLNYKRILLKQMIIDSSILICLLKRPLIMIFLR